MKTAQMQETITVIANQVDRHKKAITNTVMLIAERKRVGHDKYYNGQWISADVSDKNKVPATPKETIRLIKLKKQLENELEVLEGVLSTLNAMELDVSDPAEEASNGRIAKLKENFEQEVKKENEFLEEYYKRELEVLDPKPSEQA